MVILLAITMLFLLHGTVKAEALALIHVYDETGSSKDLILGAIGDARFVLSVSGIRTRWELCGRWDKSRCAPIRQPNQFSLTITNREDGIASTTALGYALPFTPAADHAAAILPRIRRFVQGQGSTALRSLLGAVIAHEIGHLLLRSNDHGDGIMQARWELPDVRRMAKRLLLFTPDQTRALRAGLRQRLAN